MDFEKLFYDMHPGFFERDNIKSIPEGRIYEEMVLPLNFAAVQVLQMETELESAFAERSEDGGKQPLVSETEHFLSEVEISVPENTTFGYYSGDFDKLLAAVKEVDESWAPLYHPDDRIYCGFVCGEIASFCMVEDMGVHTVDGVTWKIGGPGCVGTVPKFRRQGIGLKMIQDATNELKDFGYDVSYIHYTGVAPWYARLGYKTVLKWNANGIVPAQL